MVYRAEGLGFIRFSLGGVGFGVQGLGAVEFGV